MKRAVANVISLREVRHHGPDDTLHHEPLSVRERIHGGSIPPHRHETVHQFQLVESGVCRVLLDGIEHTPKAPFALSLPPGVVHGFSFEPGCQGQQTSVPADELKAALQGDATLLAALGTTMLVTSQDVPASSSFGDCIALFNAMAREFGGRQPGRRTALLLNSAQLALWFHRSCASQGQAVHVDPARDTLVQRYLALVEQHYRSRCTIGFYAAQLDVTPDHLSRVCRMVKGESAIDLLHERMYLEARRLLAYSDLRIADVAQALGFEDSGYFTRFFTRRAGQPPAAYRVAASAQATAPVQRQRRVNES
jgi:AraC family transcriptional activator of pobA